MNRQVSNGRRYGLDLVKTAQKGRVIPTSDLEKSRRLRLAASTGWGVEAASDRPSIRKGSFLCIYSGEVITWQEAE